ncbi:MAG: hypothetical protein GXP45_02295 [bacterium]|nr:hypothetical protein [bacterium]
MARQLRASGYNAIKSLTIKKIGKALDYANKNKIRYFVIYDTNEKKQGIYKIKDLITGEEREEKFNH